MCCYCDFSVGNAEHALFVCAKWGMAREALGQAVRAELTPDTMVFLMLQSERNWTLIESFVKFVIKTRELSFLSWLARLVDLPNERVAADEGPGRTDNGRVVRNF